MPAATCTCPTDWSGYCQAGAILFSGFAAVFGAVVIAWRQNELKKLEIKVNLLDRRLKLIERLRKVQIFFTQKAALNPPDTNQNTREMIECFEEARAIFTADDAERINLLMRECFQVEAFESAGRIPEKWQKMREIMENGFPDLLKDLIAHARIDGI